MIVAQRYTDLRRRFAAGVLQGLMLAFELAAWDGDRLSQDSEHDYEDLVDGLEGHFIPAQNDAILLAPQGKRIDPDNVVAVVKINDDGTFFADTRNGGNHDLNRGELASLLKRSMKTPSKSGNAVNVIYPYFHGCTWVFDDEEHGLVKEPFVAGADVLITLATKLKGLKKAEDGFKLTFSAGEFPGYDLKFDWVRMGQGGNYYKCDQLGGREGWLCPALFKYFPADAPKNIFVCISAK